MKKAIQAGAIPFRRGANGLEFLLITSKKGKWIFPKGFVDRGETTAITAKKETREEAGIDGNIVGGTVGSYPDVKRGTALEVIFHLLEYVCDIQPWEEAHLRKKKWCSLEEARELLQGEALRQLLDHAYEILTAKD